MFTSYKARLSDGGYTLNKTTSELDRPLSTPTDPCLAISGSPEPLCKDTDRCYHVLSIYFSQALRVMVDRVDLGTRLLGFESWPCHLSPEQPGASHKQSVAQHRYL